MIIHFDITEAREIELIHSTTGDVILVTYMDGSVKKFEGRDAQYIQAAVKDFYQPYSKN